MKVRLLFNTNDSAMVDMLNDSGILMGSISIESLSLEIRRDLYAAYEVTGDKELELTLSVE